MTDSKVSLRELIVRADSLLSLLWHRHLPADRKDFDLSRDVESTIADLRKAGSSKASGGEEPAAAAGSPPTAQEGQDALRALIEALEDVRRTLGPCISACAEARAIRVNRGPCLVCRVEEALLRQESSTGRT